MENRWLIYLYHNPEKEDADVRDLLLENKIAVRCSDCMDGLGVWKTEINKLKFCPFCGEKKSGIYWTGQRLTRDLEYEDGENLL